MSKKQHAPRPVAVAPIVEPAPLQPAPGGTVHVLAPVSGPGGFGSIAARLAAAGAPKAKAMAVKPAKPLKPVPTADNPAFVTGENGSNVAYWREGDTLMMAVSVAPEVVAQAEAPINAKTGKPSPNRDIARAKGEGFGALELDGMPFKLTLWLGIPNK